MMSSVGDSPTPEYTLPGVVDYLLLEWRRWERERAQWDKERAQLQEKIGKLEGERSGHERIKTDLLRRIKMLEHVLRQERLKAGNGGNSGGATPTAIPADPFGSLTQPLTNYRTLPSGLNRTGTLGATAGSRTLRPTRSRTLLKKYLDEMTEVDELLRTRSGYGRPVSAPTNPAAVTLSAEATSTHDNMTSSATMPAPSSRTPAVSFADPMAGRGGRVTSSRKPLENSTIRVAPSSAISDDASDSATPTVSTTSDGAATTWAQQYVLRTHLDSVRSLAFSDAALVTASDDATLKLWSLRRLARGRDDIEPAFTYRGHDSAILSVVVSQQKQQIFSSSLDSTIRVWTLLNPNSLAPYVALPGAISHCVNSLVGHTDAVWDLAFQDQNSMLASASSDGTVKLWSTDKASPLLHTVSVSQAFNGAIPTSVAFSNQSQWIIVGDTHSNLHMVDLVTGQTVNTISCVDTGAVGGPESQINKIAVHPHLPLVFSAHENKHIKMIDINAGNVVHTMVAHPQSVSSIAVENTGLYLASGGHDGSLRFWDITKRVLVQELPAHYRKYDEGVLCVAYHPNKTFVASGGADSLVKLYQ